MDNTYVLIKEYPGSPKLGKIVQGNHGWTDANGTVTNRLSDYPEFWQLQEKVEFTKKDVIEFARHALHNYLTNDRYSVEDWFNKWEASVRFKNSK